MDTRRSERSQGIWAALGRSFLMLALSGGVAGVAGGVLFPPEAVAQEKDPSKTDPYRGMYKEPDPYEEIDEVVEKIEEDIVAKFAEESAKTNPVFADPDVNRAFLQLDHWVQSLGQREILDVISYVDGNSLKKGIKKGKWNKGEAQARHTVTLYDNFKLALEKAGGVLVKPDSNFSHLVGKGLSTLEDFLLNLHARRSQAPGGAAAGRGN